MDEPLYAPALDVFAATPAVLRSLLAALPDGIVAAPADDGWSPKDVVAHLVSLNGPTLLDRVQAIIEQDDPLLPDIDEHDVLERSGLRGRPLAELLDELARQRADAVARLRGLSPEVLARTGRHSVVGRLTAAEVIHHKAWHDLLHIQQVCRMVAAPLDLRRGPMRVFQ